MDFSRCVKDEAHAGLNTEERTCQNGKYRFEEESRAKSARDTLMTQADSAESPRSIDCWIIIALRDPSKKNVETHVLVLHRLQHQPRRSEIVASMFDTVPASVSQCVGQAQFC